jgi:signal transduction histidine kinase
MVKANEWPYVPLCLGEFIPEDQLSVIQSGCCHHLGGPITVLDCDPDTGKLTRRIEPLDMLDHYQPFCKLFRDLGRVIGGNTACEACDRSEAQASLDHFRSSGERSRTFECHMGLRDMTYLLCISDVPVAVVFSGQYCPDQGSAAIEERVRLLGTGRYAHLKLDGTTREKLLDLARSLQRMPGSAPLRLASEAQHIEKIANDSFRQAKRSWEESFLDSLRHTAMTVVGPLDPDALQEKLMPLLQQVCDFCRCKWAICFGSIQEGDTVLAPVASAGIPADIASSLPHFNWRKAGLPADFYASRDLHVAKWSKEVGARGIRGDNSDYLTGSGCLLLPFAQDARYMSVLALGPFPRPANLEAEQRFLNDMVEIVCSAAIMALEVTRLVRERQRWKTTASLLSHQLRTALTPINTKIGWAKGLLRERMGPTDVGEVRRLLSLAEEMCMRLAQSSRETLAGHIMQIEADDLQLDYYPLAILVANVASGHASAAQEKGCSIVVQPTVEMLPQAHVDVGRLTIALGNLLENAVKYCYPNTEITVRAQLDLADTAARWALLTARIQIQDIGYPVPVNEQERIFEQGARGRAFVSGRIPGTGLGLWEAREIVRAHGGDIGMSCDSVAGWRGREPAYRVVFEMRIPVKKEAKR